jgi:hypothetical protein
VQQKATWLVIIGAGILLVVLGVTGRAGDLLGAVFAPDEMVVDQ